MATILYHPNHAAEKIANRRRRGRNPIGVVSISSVRFLRSCREAVARKGMSPFDQYIADIEAERLRGPQVAGVVNWELCMRRNWAEQVGPALMLINWDFGPALAEFRAELDRRFPETRKKAH